MNAIIDETGTLSARAMLVRLKISFWHGERIDRVQSESVTRHAKAEADTARVIKRLPPKKALDHLNLHVGRAREAWRQNTMPWLDDGQRILPVDNWMQFSTRMDPIFKAFNIAADVFSAQYPAMVLAARQRLGRMYNEADFPLPEQVRGMYSMEIQPIPVPSAGDWRVELDNDTVDAIRKHTEAVTQEGVNIAMKDLVARMYRTVSRLQDRIEDFDNGKVKYLRTELVDSIDRIADQIPGFNICGNGELDSIAADMKARLTASGSQGLKDDGVRLQVKDAAGDILERIRALGLAA